MTTPATVSAGSDVILAFDGLVSGKPYTVNWGDTTIQQLTGNGAPINVAHQYKKDGIYTITANGSNSLLTRASTQVTVKSPPPTLNVSGTGLSANLSVNGLQPDTQYTVDWGDNTAPDTAKPQLSHTYAAAKTYTVTLYGGAAVLAMASYTATLGQVVLSLAPDKPVIGQQVVLNATGLAPAATYQLNWGDGTTESGITGQSALNRTHSYASAQDFTVTVQSGGATLGTATVAVQVPSPALTPSVQGLTLTLQVASLVAGAAYTVDWGDGPTEPLNASAPATTLTHPYTRPGTYTVVVSPARGQPSSRPVTLVAGSARLSIQPATVETDQTVTAAMADLIKTLTYTLDWKDGPPVTFTATDTSATQTHTYATPGSYQVDLTAPGTNPVSAPVTVRAAAPTLQLSASDLTATLVATKLYTGVTYTINWGGGATESFQATGPTMTFTHSYAAPGVQTVTVTPGGGTPATATVTLTVPAPTLNVTPAQGSTDTTFTAVLGQLIPTLTYTLNWGDGATEPVTGAATFTRTHQYAKPGTFTVAVTSPDAPSVSQPVTVRVPAPLLNATNTNLDATLRLSRLVQTATYRVQWGDGQEQSLTAQTPETTLTHTYAAPGSYTLTVTPTLGDAATVTLNVRYASVAAPTLSVTPVTASVYTEVRADFGAMTAALSYTLDWGDGQREVVTGLTVGTRIHTYTTAGTYTVNLKAPESPAATVTVAVTQPVATLVASSAGLQAQATLTGLVKALTYRLDWGDGTPAVDVTGVETQTLTHPYARPGEYRLTLSVPGGAPVTTTLSLTVQGAVLTPVANALTVTANVSGLQERLTYRLAWGDGSSTDTTGKAADTLTHTYDRPGAYTLTLSTPGTASVTASVNLRASPVVLTVVSPELRATASLNGLVSALTYTVNWGDGQQDTLTGQSAATLVHLYQKPGQYTVTVTAPGTDPVAVSLTVGLPPQEVVTVTPSVAPGTVPGTQEIRITGLLTNATYLLDYGDGQTEPLAFIGQSGLWTHRYDRTGVYSVTLLLRTADGVNSVRAVTVVQAQQPLTLNAVTVAFPRDPSNTSLSLSTLGAVPVQLSVNYTGSGTLTGTWVLDGQPGPAVTLDLSEQGGPATANYSVDVPKPGRHTLSFQITGLTPRCAAACPQPTLLAANTVAYTLDSPDTLAYGGLTVKLTTVTNLDLKAFTGTGTVRLVVAGVDLGSQNVTLTNLTVTRSDAVYKVTGGSPTAVDLNNLPLRALGLGQASVSLQTLTLSPDTAALSGAAVLPGATGAPLTFTDARLQDGGFIAALSSSGPGLKDLAIGATGVSVTAASGVLDLSSTQNADALGAAYKRSTSGVSGPGWMGIVLTDARLSIGAPLISGTPVAVTAPVAYTLGGYTTAFDLTATTLPFGGWSVKTTGLQFALSANTIDSVSGKGAVTVPMVNEALPLDISWNPQLGTPGAKWVFSSAGSPPVHNFGRTKLDLGTPAWETRGDGSAALVFSNAKWDLGNVSGTEVKVPVYDMTFTSDGGVSLGGQAWASATGLTNFTLFDYPFPAGEVGARREADGQYTLSLRGKIQLGELLPLNAVAQPISFWVKDGKDVKIVFEKLRVFGQIKTVDYDVSVSAMFKDENTLEFIGEGSLKIAKKIAVATKAGFGRDNGTGYGFFWASVASPSMRPFVTVGSVGFYEFSGGVGINMVWKDGKFDAPPVKAIPPAGAARVVNVAIQAGTVFGTAVDNGTTAHFRGTLGVDSEGTVAIKAVGWLFTPLELGALNTYSVGADSAAGPNLSTVSTKGGLSPQVAALVLLSVPPENPNNGYLLVQGCVGPAARSAVGGLDCSRNRELDFYNIVAVSGYAELYMPFSGSDQHVYLGTKANPISVRLLSIKSGSTTTTTTAAVKNKDGTTTPATSSTTANSSSNSAAEGSNNTTTSRSDGLGYNGYLMVDSTKTSVGVGVSLAYSVGQSGTGAVCDWYYYANAHLALNADFTVVYNPTSLDASVTLSAGAAAGAGACGIDVNVGINLAITGRLYVSAASSYIDGTASGTVTMPVIPDIPFSVSGRVNF